MAAILHNPDQATSPAMTVHFTTTREDFQPNIDDSSLEIEHVLLYVARSSGQAFTVSVDYLRFTPKGITGYLGGGAESNEDGVLSTRSGNAASWTAIKARCRSGNGSLPCPTARI